MRLCCCSYVGLVFGLCHPLREAVLQEKLRTGELNSKRIALKTDIVTDQKLIIPELVPPAGSLVILGLVANDPCEGESVAKQSVGCVSALLFLLCLSRCILFLLCQIQSICRANFKKYF
jgi:hypothetical protein